ncbi:LysR family transcriptional regulator [Enterococcus sp. AZ109]|uniref:LysR family transcriptional regulator n=1 Tax=Enterococcus sp. AZ109 TaxID=2774634 RepID=UPI003F1FC5D3
MKLKNLKTFHYCATYLNFSQAADYLKISQPAVTNQIKNIEAALEHELFVRAGRKLFLTTAGEILFNCSTDVFRLCDATIKELSELSQGKLTLRIAGDVNYLSMHVSAIIVELYQAFPDVKIEIITVENSKKIFDGVRNKEYDIGIMSANYSDFGIRQRLISEENVSLIASVAVASALKKNPDLEVPLLEYNSKSSYNSFLWDFMIQNNLTNRKKITFNNLELVRKTLLSNTGIAVLSEDVLKKDLNEGKVEVLTVPNCKSVKIKTRLIYRADNPMYAKIKKCSDLIVEGLQVNS